MFVFQVSLYEHSHVHTMVAQSPGIRMARPGQEAGGACHAVQHRARRPVESRQNGLPGKGIVACGVSGGTWGMASQSAAFSSARRKAQNNLVGV